MCKEGVQHQESIYDPQVSDRELLIGLINAVGVLARELTGGGLLITLNDKGAIIFADDRRAIISDGIKNKRAEDAERAKRASEDPVARAQ